MNLEEYFSATRAIHAELAQIAETTRSMAYAGTANPANLQFTQLMARHFVLVNQFQQVHGRFIADNPEFNA